MRIFVFSIILLLVGCAGVNKRSNIETKTIELPQGLDLTVNDFLAAISAHLPILEKGVSRDELLSQLSEEHKNDIIINIESRVVLFTKVTTDQTASNNGMKQITYKFENGRLIEGPKLLGDMNHIKWESNNNKTSIDGDCWGYVSNAVKLRDTGKYYESLEEIERHNVCDKSETRMSYFYHKGWTLYEMGKYQSAVEAFTKGLETDKNYIYAYWRRGLALEALGDVKEAQEDYRRGYEVGLKEHGKKFFEYWKRIQKLKKS